MTFELHPECPCPALQAMDAEVDWWRDHALKLLRIVETIDASVMPRWWKEEIVLRARAAGVNPEQKEDIT